MKKMFMAVIAFMMTLSASAQFYIYFSDGQIAQVDSISVQPIAYTITLNRTDINLEVGDIMSLYAAVSPVVNNITHTINWTSSNPDVVSVNSIGEVTALAAGTATITATMDAEEVTPATCVVNVTNNNDAVLNTFEIGGYALFNLGSPIAGTDTVLEISVGAVTCQLAPALYYVWVPHL